MRMLLCLALVACSKPTPPRPCERGGTVGVHLVDNDAPYMRAVYQKVSPDRNDVPTDPDALAANVQAKVDQWRRSNATSDENALPREAGPLQTDYYLRGDTRQALVAYLAKLPPLPEDRSIVFEHTRDAGYRTYYIGKSPILETRHVADVREGDGHVDVELTAEGRAIFAKATAEAAKVGKKLAILVDGEVTSAPVIEDEIEGGHVGLMTPDPAALAKQLACVTAPAR